MAGSITRRGPSSWRLKFEAGTRDPASGKRQTRYVTVRGTKRDAQRKLHALLTAVDNGTAVDPSRVTVAEHLRDWLSQASHLANKTRERYRGLIDQQIIPHLGRVAVQRLRPAHIADWHATLLRSGGKDGCPLSARTVGHAHRVLHTALARAVQLEIVARNVASMVHPPKVDVAEVVILTSSQIGNVLAKLADHRMLPIVAVAVGAGLRRGEICALRWGDVDLDTGLLRVECAMEQTGAGLQVKEPKTRHGRRRITLPGFVVDALKIHRREQLEQRLVLGLGRPGVADLVFTLPNGSPWGPDYLSRCWHRATSVLGLPQVGLHALRHSHASALIAAGIDPLTISRRLGHGSPAFTLTTYGHLFANTDAAAARAIDGAIGSKR